MIDNNHILFERMKKEKFLFFFFFRLCLYRLLVIERQEIMIHWKAFFPLSLSFIHHSFFACQYNTFIGKILFKFLLLRVALVRFLQSVCLLFVLLRIFFTLILFQLETCPFFRHFYPCYWLSQFTGVFIE
jgi:hypothetical protein